MNFNDYQQRAIASLREETTLEVLGLKLIEKSGEIAGLCKTELLKSPPGTAKERKQIMSEAIGWALWDIAAIAHLNGIDLGQPSPSRSGLGIYPRLARHCSYVCSDIFDPVTSENIQSLAEHLELVLDDLLDIAKDWNLSLEAIAAENLAKVEAKK